MAYDQVGIVNLGLGRIGVGRISSIDENTNQAIRAKAAWEYLVDEVLARKDWIFAKTRVALAQSTTEPVYGWSYAYPLPADFIRLAKGHKTSIMDDVPVSPDGYPYVVETLASGQLVLLSNYDNSSEDLYIRYIRRIGDYRKFSAAFVKALGFRIAAEMAIPLAEGMKKFEMMMNLYELALKEADGLNASMDYVEDERGSDSWELAGRDTAPDKRMTYSVTEI